jgi:hypothetical protein
MENNLAFPYNFSISGDKMHRNFVITAICMLFMGSIAHAQYNAVLPKGVRSVILRNITTSEVGSKFNNKGAESAFGSEFAVDSNTLSQSDSETIQEAMDLLQSDYPDAFDALRLGTYQIDAKANVEVDVFGFAYGMTDNLTAYFGVPFYKADVRLKYSRKQDNSYNEVGEILNNYTNDDMAGIIGATVEQMFDVDGPVIQNQVVQGYGYRELGDWSGNGPGDMEFGLMYAFQKATDGSGLMLTLGGVAPTGYVDDPDVIQDFGFGDGQWDAFAEFGGSYTMNSHLILNAYTRYTHQFASDKTLRVNEAANGGLNDEKDVFTEKLGDMMLFDVSSDIILNDWISLTPSFRYETRERAHYIDSSGMVNQQMGDNSNFSAQMFRMQAAFSSVTPYTKGNFILPAQIKFGYQTILDGENTPKFDRYELEFRMYF